ncbi:MAG: YtxH domain-containing protein [Acidobacteriia bacterium]|nr:YtxH domain-containing protein [Terriglobia bacterium]
MSDSSRYGGAHLLVAFLAGAAAGAAVAYLTAPGSGRETREQLKGWAGDARAKAVRVPHAFREAYAKAAEAAKAAFVEALRDSGGADPTG